MDSAHIAISVCPIYLSSFPEIKHLSVKIPEKYTQKNGDKDKQNIREIHAKEYRQTQTKYQRNTLKQYRLIRMMHTLRGRRVTHGNNGV